MSDSFLADLTKLFSGFTSGQPLARDDVAGLTVSTVLTPDMGFETALGDANGFHHVERYGDEDEARAGHTKWVAAAPALTTITKLGYGSLIDEEQITIRRK